MTRIKKDKYAVNVDAIKELQNQSGLKQKNIPTEMAKVGLKMSLRTYQRILKPKLKHSEEAVNTIALFYSKYLQSINIEKPVTFENLIEGKVRDKKIENKIPKNPLELEHLEETTFLHRIQKYGPLQRAIRLSSARKFYYPTLPNSKQIAAMKETIKYITKIFNDYKSKGKYHREYRDTESYSDIETELYQLETYSGFTNTILNLNETGLHLYAGNYTLHDVAVGTTQTQTELVCKPVIKGKNYSIFCFDKASITFSKTFKYLNPFPVIKLKAILKEYPMTEQGNMKFSIKLKDATEEELGDHVSWFENQLVHQYYGFDEYDDSVIGSYNNLKVSRSSIYTTSISELNEQSNKELIRKEKVKI
tara:strand:- start:118 stop:1206 length:1089 start_codon:yes stop_codon:yes gene_type:complete